MTENTDRVEIVALDRTARAIVAAEVDVAVATARRYPRDLSLSLKRAGEMSTFNRDVAEQCTYRLPRKDSDGNPIEGPSIGFARILVAAFGNCRTARRMAAIEAEFVVAQGVCHDLESNSLEQVDVVRSILDRNGNRYPQHVIQSTAQAAMAIAERNAILAVFSRAVWLPVYQRAHRVAIGADDPKSIAARTHEVLRRIAERWGIGEARALAAVGCASRDDVDDKAIGGLLGLGQGVVDGVHTAEEAFPPIGEPVGSTPSPDEQKGPSNAEEGAEVQPQAPAPEDGGAPRAADEAPDLGDVETLDLDGVSGTITDSGA